MEENVNSCPNGDGAFSSPSVHGVMPEIYFFSKLKPLKLRNQNFPLPRFVFRVSSMADAQEGLCHDAAVTSVRGHYPVYSCGSHVALCC